MKEIGIVIVGVVIFLWFMSYADRQPHEDIDDDEEEEP
jgi:hypothetical protein